jgi:hypothetical protein
MIDRHPRLTWKPSESSTAMSPRADTRCEDAAAA